MFPVWIFSSKDQQGAMPMELQGQWVLSPPTSRSGITTQKISWRQRTDPSQCRLTVGYMNHSFRWLISFELVCFVSCRRRLLACLEWFANFPQDLFLLQGWDVAKLNLEGMTYTDLNHLAGITVALDVKPLPCFCMFDVAVAWGILGTSGHDLRWTLASISRRRRDD